MQPPLKVDPSSMPPVMTHIADGQRRRTRLLIMDGVHEVTPLLTSSSSFSSSSSSPILPSDTNASSPCCLPVISHNWRYWKPAGRTSTIGLIAAAAVAKSIFRSLLLTIHSLVIPPCRPAATIQASSGRSRKAITGTFFGPRRGRVCFAVQSDPRSDPVLLLDLAIPTSHLVKEMASGMVRILLDCQRGDAGVTGGGKERKGLLREEPRWTVYCNGQKRGYAAARACGDAEFRVLRAVQAVSVGAGVLPAMERTSESLKGDVMYMRARFERVVGGKDSEAFYMINPDSSARNRGAPAELSIFLLRK